jgi:hypothetical protein
MQRNAVKNYAFSCKLINTSLSANHLVYVFVVLPLVGPLPLQPLAKVEGHGESRVCKSCNTYVYIASPWITILFTTQFIPYYYLNCTKSLSFHSTVYYLLFIIIIFWNWKKRFLFHKRIQRFLSSKKGTGEMLLWSLIYYLHQVILVKEIFISLPPFIKGAPLLLFYYYYYYWNDKSNPTKQLRQNLVESEVRCYVYYLKPVTACMYTRCGNWAATSFVVEN